MTTGQRAVVGDNGGQARDPSTRDIADLARAGFEIARRTLTTVDFEVHHLTNRPVDLGALVPGWPAPDTTGSTEPAAGASPTFVETLTSSANGVGAVIGTRTRSLQEKIAATNEQGQAHAATPEISPGCWVFRQTASPNPTFIYESAQVYEGLIVVDPEETVMRHWHAAALRDLISDICQVAANDAHAPLLTLQTPAQLPPATRTRDHDLRTRKEILPFVPSAIAVRFSIALQNASAELFFRLSDRIRILCEENGYGLWLADSRPGHRAGNWFGICKPDEPGRHYRATLRAGNQITTCLPITCVGPARVGSTYAIVSFLRRYARVGLVSCVDCTLDDLALIHFQLALQGVSVDRLNKIVANMLKATTVVSRPRDVLADLFSRLSVAAGPARDGGDDLAARASDYQIFMGPAFGYQPPAATDRLPVWIAWQITKKDNGLAGPLGCLYQALDHVVPNTAADGRPRVPLSAVTHIEYLVCHETERSVLRGKGKLSVPADVLPQFEGADTEAPASTFCLLVEEAWKMQTDLAGITGVDELTVAWREHWLSHWTYS